MDEAGQDAAADEESLHRILQRSFSPRPIGDINHHASALAGRMMSRSHEFKTTNEPSDELISAAGVVMV